MRFLGWFGALSLGAMLVTPVSAQEPVYGIGLGRSVGGNPFFERHLSGGVGGGGIGRGSDESGWQVQTFSEWSLVDRPFTLRAEALYSRLMVDTRLDHWFATVGSILTPRPGATGFRPYAIAGGALFFNRAPGASAGGTGVPANEWAWIPGFNLGAGFAMSILSLRTGLEVRRHEGVFEEDGNGWFSIALLARMP
jgi:hypothetical protein